MSLTGGLFLSTFLILGDRPSLDRLSQSLVEGGHEVLRAADAATAEEHLSTWEVDLIIVDRMSDQGLDLPDLSRLISQAKPAEPLILAPAAGLEDLARGLKLSPDRVLESDSPPERVAACAEAIMASRRLSHSEQYLRHTQDIVYRPENVVTRSTAIISLLNLAARVAKSNHSVLLTGETGTGKGLFAGLIHFNSLRADKPFVEVNCAALPDPLLESEFFGHVRGAFTGAIKDRVGRFEQAEGGTVFLDEIGDMNALTQAKLLRVLEEKSFERLGSSRTKRIDVRILAATNKDLQSEMEGGRFREDLFYRINVLSIQIPALRERIEDIRPLARFFLARSLRDLKRDSLTLAEESLQSLERYRWPGNVRELKNVIERAALLAPGPVIRPQDLNIDESKSRTQPRQGWPSDQAQRFALSGLTLAQAERLLILDTLERTGWVQKEAAKLLGISRRALNYKVAKLQLTHPSWSVNRPPDEDEDDV